MKKALITGITGQDGSYLTELLLEKGYEVHGIVRRHSSLTRERLDPIREGNPLAKEHLKLHYGDMVDGTSLHVLFDKIRPHEIYNLASQSHVKVSFEQPEYTLDVIGNGTVRLLEANRLTGVMARVYQASSSEMFGKPTHWPQNEKTPLNPITPYGASKAFAHQMCQIYRESYDMFVTCGILYNHESPRRGEHFVTRKICKSAARIAKGLQKSLQLGNLEAQRDWGYAPEYVEAMWLMLQQERPANYVVATGKFHSVRDLVNQAFEHVGIDPEPFIQNSTDQLRPGDANQLVGDYSKAETELHWVPKTSFSELVQIMVDAEMALLSQKA